jgi:hypothetical protein
MTDELERDDDMLARYRAGAGGAPDAALDGAILNAAARAGWVQRYAGWFAVPTMVAATALVFIDIGSVVPQSEPPVIVIGGESGRVQEFLMDPARMQDAAQKALPGGSLHARRDVRED